MDDPIQNKMKYNHLGKEERKPVFADFEKDVFTKRVDHICSWRFPLDMLDLRLLIKSYLTKTGQTVSYFNNTPGKDLARNFVTNSRN